MSLLKHSFRLANRVLLRTTQSSKLLGGQRHIHRWVAPTLRELSRRRKLVGPDPVKPRSSFLEWNYDMELYCFGKRLGEKFDEKFLKEALVQREWANKEEFNAQTQGNDAYIPEANNQELADEGSQIISKYIKQVYAESYPTDVVNAVHDYLTTDDMLAHVGKHLGMIDLIKAVEYPLETKTIADAFKAVVAALSLSSDLSRAQLFVKDFVISQMNGKDIYDIWTPEKPFDYLLKLLQETGVNRVEPRLCNRSAVNTILANYQVGLYDEDTKKLIGIGWGETVKVAQDTAALDAIQKIYSFKS